MVSRSHGMALVWSYGATWPGSSLEVLIWTTRSGGIRHRKVGFQNTGVNTIESKLSDRQRHQTKQTQWPEVTLSQTHTSIERTSFTGFPRTPYSMGQLEGRTQLWWEVRVRRGGVSVKLTNPQRTYTPRRLAKLHQIAAVWCTGQFRAPNLEHLPLPLRPFEFPRPFEVFEGGRC